MRYTARVRGAVIVGAALGGIGCGAGPFRGGSAGRTPDASCCRAEGARIADRYRVSAITSRRFTHAELWSALEPSLRSSALRSSTIGASLQNRALRAITWGRGPTTVLLWSQMHGDESTATMSLADLIAWMAATGRDRDALRELLADRLTVVMVPMLNPDGAELFQRENALGVDINRDARRLTTPEGRALKALRDSLKPTFGFNLHDQNARTLGGANGKQVGIALLAPAADAEKSYGPVRAKARLVAARMRTVLEEEIPGRVAKYDDAFNPRAFGDLIQSWGTSAVLIESGALPDDPEKQRLRRVNVVALLTALEAIATARYETADPNAYESLATNTSGVVDVLITGGFVMLPGQPPLRADISANYDDVLRKQRPRVREVGDLSAVVALDTIDVTGMYLHPMAGVLTEQANQSWLRLSAPLRFEVRRGVSPTSALVRVVGERP